MSNQPLRLAIYGFVEKEAGGLASANFLVLKCLLQRGHAIDFYAIDPWIQPTDLFSFASFRYLGFCLPLIEWGWKVVNHLPSGLRSLGQVGYSKTTTGRYMRAINAAMCQAHREQPYDALLSLGLLSPFRVPGLPTVSWDQGTPNGEREALVRQRPQMVRFCGRALYCLLMTHYRVKQFLIRRRMRQSQVVIAGSRWAVESWHQLGLPRGQGFALPYPLDLEQYVPARRQPGSGQPIDLLHLGRLVPRKRLDLLLEAFQLLRRDDPEVRLRIIGYFAYARGYEAFLEDPRLMAGVEYHPRVPRAAAREALRQADILVQPSENENFGTAVAEAQACGLPVVLGPTNGTGDYLDTDEFRFSAYEAPSVADAMAWAVQAMRTRREEVTAAARAAAERHYDVGQVVEKLEAILRQAAGQGHGSRAGKSLVGLASHHR